MDESFGLVAFKLCRLVRVSPEIAILQSGPIDAVEPVQRVMKFGGLEHGVAIGEDERDRLFLHCGKRGNQNSYLRHGALDDSATCLDVEEHWGVIGEIERYVVAKGAAGRDGYNACRPARNNFGIPDGNVVGIGMPATAAVEPIREYPRYIGDVGNSKNQSLVGIQIAHLDYSHDGRRLIISESRKESFLRQAEPHPGREKRSGRRTSGNEMQKCRVRSCRSVAEVSSASQCGYSRFVVPAPDFWVSGPR